MDNIFFDSWAMLFQTLVCAITAYIAIVALLLFSGKRTLSKWNAFDFVITIAFGSMLASIILIDDISVVQGIFALVLLIGLQFLVSWGSTHIPGVESLVKATPSLLLYRGELQTQTMKHARVTESEIYAAIRQNGFAALEDIEAVVLETNGNFSVIDQLRHSSASALKDVEGYRRDTMAV